MNLCHLCGQTVVGEEIHSHHGAGYGESWARGNRIMCDFFHRGIVPPRVAEIDPDFWHYGMGL